MTSRRLQAVICALLAGLAFVQPLGARKFYPDDPLLAVPPPRPAVSVESRKLSDYYDFFRHTLAEPGEKHPSGNPIPAREVNTLGEVPDNAWYTNRHYHKPMTLEELVRGPGVGSTPATDTPWKVVAAKAEGITPGFTILDSQGRRYILKFDPLDYPEIATAADVIVSKFFHAAGYFVPENYIVEFDREQLVLADETVVLRDPLGNERAMTERDVTEVLLNVPRNSDGRYRGVASVFLAGRPVGPFRYYGTRTDDPNDVVPHEHRRDLRGLSVFCAWLGHDDSRSINTLDMLVEDNGVPHVKHYLIDFGSTLGSASNGPNSPRSGHEYLFSWKPSIVQFFTFGLLVPGWARADFPDLPSVGRFDWKTFDAAKWVPEYPNPAFTNRLPDDAFWAAKQVMSFTDEQIRAIVKTGQYSDPRAEDWIVECLIARRDRIGRAFLTPVLPLDRFAVRDGRLIFEDLALTHQLVASRNYTIQWSHFDNDAETKTPLAGETSFALPRSIDSSQAGEHFVADIQSDDPGKKVSVYLRKQSNGVEVIGIDRTW